MKHVFVVNPYAGPVDATLTIEQQLKDYKGALDYEVYVTKGPLDATRFCSQYCEDHAEDTVRFYACGGDGTINEVVSGIVGKKNAQMSCYPCGSGNDYIKYYANKEDFLDIHRIINGVENKVDVMQVDTICGNETKPRYSINVCDFGFDAAVCDTMTKVKRKPIIGGKRAYTTGIVKAIFTGRKNYSEMVVDGEPFHHGKMLLCTLANGTYIGGAYKCAPRSINNDGEIEVCLLRTISILKLLLVIGTYKRGKHLDSPRLAKIIKYRRGKVIEMKSPQPFSVIIDGDLLYGTHFRVTQLPQVLTFVSPR